MWKTIPPSHSSTTARLHRNYRRHKSNISSFQASDWVILSPRTMQSHAIVKNGKVETERTDNKQGRAEVKDVIEALILRVTK